MFNARKFRVLEKCSAYLSLLEHNCDFQDWEGRVFYRESPVLAILFSEGLGNLEDGNMRKYPKWAGLILFSLLDSDKPHFYGALSAKCSHCSLLSAKPLERFGCPGGWWSYGKGGSFLQKWCDNPSWELKGGGKITKKDLEVIIEVFSHLVSSS